MSAASTHAPSSGASVRTSMTRPVSTPRCTESGRSQSWAWTGAAKPTTTAKHVRRGNETSALRTGPASTRLQMTARGGDLVVEDNVYSEGLRSISSKYTLPLVPGSWIKYTVILWISGGTSGSVTE